MVLTKKALTRRTNRIHSLILKLTTSRTRLKSQTRISPSHRSIRSLPSVASLSNQLPRKKSLSSMLKGRLQSQRRRMKWLLSQSSLLLQLLRLTSSCKEPAIRATTHSPRTSLSSLNKTTHLRLVQLTSRCSSSSRSRTCLGSRPQVPSPAQMDSRTRHSARTSSSRTRTMAARSARTSSSRISQTEACSVRIRASRLSTSLVSAHSTTKTLL